MKVRVSTVAWWRVWCWMGKLLRMVRRADDWVRGRYAHALTREVMRRQAESEST